MLAENLKNKRLCDNCDLCCQYVTVEIDKPKSKSAHDNIIWLLLHENVNVFTDHDNDWYVEFITPCQAWDKKTKLCAIYKNRPQICRDYKQKDCVKYVKEPAEKIYFKKAEDFKKYLKNKNIDYNLSKNE